MKKIMILFMLICLSVNSQTKSTLYLDYYVLTSQGLLQYIQSSVINRLSDKDICTISAKGTKKGTLICISASENKQLNIDKIEGYLLISDHYFFYMAHSKCQISLK